MLIPPSSPPTQLGRTLVIGGLAASLLSITVASAALASQAARAPMDPCGTGIDDAALSSRDRGFVARRLLACSDVTHGRISDAEYHQQIAEIDAAWSTRMTPVVIAPPTLQWASSIRGFSTQYTTASWAADRVLGPPDVFPSHGDNANAWASLGADDRDEWIEVGYAQPMQVSAVEVLETFNPGAVTAIEMITASGQRIVAYQGAAGAKGQGSNTLRVDVGCTSEPIVAVSVRLASTKVAGWNELDAIGLAPCAEQ
ncbi:MAG: hypothetical protein IPQ07_36495 [Myxococcales bacterium]|nr:hypothetical protein [Myxococcales bacterium]